jgi:SecD/SecF fusion protein
MKNKGLFLALTVVISFLCGYYLTFTYIARNIEKEADEFAMVNGKTDPIRRAAYLDSLWVNPAVNVLGIDMTYKDIKEKEVKLGLDLMGGMHVTMEVDAGDILRVLSDNNSDKALAEALEAARQAQKTQQGSFVELFAREFRDRNPGKTLASVFSNKNNAGRIDFSSDDNKVIAYLNSEVQSTIDRSFEILRTRIDKFGVTQPNIQQLKGTNRIQIELPGISDAGRARKILQSVAKLEFFEVWTPAEISPYFNTLNDFMVKEENLAKTLKNGKVDDLFGTDSAAAPKADSTVAKTDSASGDTGAAALAKQIEGKSDTGKGKADSLSSKSSAVLAKLFKPTYFGLGASIRDTAKVNRLLAREEVKAIFPANMKALWAIKPEKSQSGEKAKDEDAILSLYFVKKSRDNQAPLEGSVITEAFQDYDERGQPDVNMKMNAEGSRIWRRLTAANVGRQIAIALDNYVYSAPNVKNEIPNGSSSISGSFTLEEAKDLANILKAGKMPVPTRIVEEEVVGPTLGQQSINQGLMSIIAGFLVIILFMIAYYSNSGVVADLAVLLNVFFISGILVQVDAVLTLPGIAGIVLTVGMAVDANVLINERIRDEIKQGKPLREAITKGYEAASTSIWDANITTVLAGIVLWYFGSGPVQGFATTLIIGIFTSLFTSVYFTRLLVEYRLSKGGTFSFSTGLSKDLFRNVNFDFVGKRKIAYVFSGLIIGGGLAFIAVTGLNYGVDFKGGWKYVVEFENPVSTEEIRSSLEKPLEGFPEVKSFGSDSKVQITTPYLIDDLSDDAAGRVQTKVEEGLKAFTKGARYEILSTAKVGPTVANDIKRNSLISVVLALGLIFIYILARFRKLGYSMGATLAIFHDALMVLVFYSVFRYILPFSLEIDQNFIAAILTIVGYSVNDTVVIFDRVREFFKDSALEADPKTVINQALNDTFSRTVITASTVLLVVLILLFFGGETIRGLSFALLIGVITGTYSTIYIAIPFVMDAPGAKKKNPAEA